MLCDETVEAGDSCEGRWMTKLAPGGSHERTNAHLNKKKIFTLPGKLKLHTVLHSMFYTNIESRSRHCLIPIMK